ncbi:MAG: acidic cytochrome c3 [Desulfobacteraceae bacterium]|nr:MAG: acidic cytochrome c3 [Desulfobacteraceae bacterium]
MMQRTAILAMALAGSAFCMALGFAQEDMQTVSNSVFSRPARSAALFAHDSHNESAAIEDCGICHHVIENGRRSETETSEDSPCSECHAPLVSGTHPIPLRRAYHLRCKGCHLASNAGPVMCAECHPRSGQK